jgi:hypothetical protein
LDQEEGPHRLRAEELWRQEKPAGDRRWLSPQGGHQEAEVVIEIHPANQPFDGTTCHICHRGQIYPAELFQLHLGLLKLVVCHGCLEELSLQAQLFVMVSKPNPVVNELPTVVALKEALLDVLTQACHEDDGVFDTMALSSYQSGWSLAVRLGIAEEVGESYGRRGFYRPKWDEINGAKS